MSIGALEHAIAIEYDEATGRTRLTCTCGETAFGRLTNVLDAWAQWHLRASVVPGSELSESHA